jgi:Mn-dependent DtxR family transcriptional regulator
MRLMEITHELGIEDHTKVNFHMKILKEAGVIEQDPDKNYSLTQEGMRTMECLKTIENFISK